MRKVAGLDAHSTYVVVTIVSNDGTRVAGPERIGNEEAGQLAALLKRYAPLEVVVEASGSWPWIYDHLESEDVHVVLAHPKKLRAIAESTTRPTPSTRNCWLARDSWT